MFLKLHFVKYLREIQLQLALKGIEKQQSGTAEL